MTYNFSKFNMKQNAYLRSTALCGLVLLLACITFNVPTYGLPTDSFVRKDWQLIAASDLVARGILVAPLKTLKQLESSGGSDYVKLKVNVREVAKGSAMIGPLEVIAYLSPHWYVSRPDSPAGLDGREVTVFLVHSDAPSSIGYYFLDDTPSCLRPFSAREFLRLKHEARKQKEVIQHFDKYSVARKDASDGLVQPLLDKLTKADTQDAAWSKLLGLDRHFVPALIRAISDNRFIAKPNVELPIRQAPNRFESIAHYKPETISDAVTILLSDKTTVDIRSLENGGSEIEHIAVANFWKVWAVHEFQNTK